MGIAALLKLSLLRNSSNWIAMLLLLSFLIGSIYVPLQNSYDTNSNESSPTQNIIISEQDRTYAIPIWVVEPTNITVNYGEWVSFQLNATSTFGDLYYWISDTDNFAIDYGTGYVWNRLVLAPGTYPIFIAVFDNTYTKLTKWIYIFVIRRIVPGYISYYSIYLSAY